MQMGSSTICAYLPHIDKAVNSSTGGLTIAAGRLVVFVGVARLLARAADLLDIGRHGVRGIDRSCSRVENRREKVGFGAPFGLCLDHRGPDVQQAMRAGPS